MKDEIEKEKERAMRKKLWEQMETETEDVLNFDKVGEADPACSGR
jgi:hypothetical protein